MRAPFVAFWVADEASGSLHMQANFDASLGREQNISQLRFGEGAVGWVAVERRRLAIDDIFHDGRFVARDWARERGFRSLFCMPILDQERLLGVLVMISGEPFRFSPDEKENDDRLTRRDVGVRLHGSSIMDSGRMVAGTRGPCSETH